MFSLAEASWRPRCPRLKLVETNWSGWRYCWGRQRLLENTRLLLLSSLAIGMGNLDGGDVVVDDGGGAGGAGDGGEDHHLLP